MHRRDKQITRIEKHMKLNKLFHAWKAATQHLIQNKHNIICARIPIIHVGPKPRTRKPHIREYIDHIKIAPGKNNMAPNIISFETYKIHGPRYEKTKSISHYAQKIKQRKPKYMENTK